MWWNTRMRTFRGSEIVRTITSESRIAMHAHAMICASPPRRRLSAGFAAPASAGEATGSDSGSAADISEDPDVMVDRVNGLQAAEPVVALAIARQLPGVER